jgi:fructoselysine-6-P-deglycase FrlB-like protein
LLQLQALLAVQSPHHDVSSSLKPILTSLVFLQWIFLEKHQQQGCTPKTKAKRQPK